MRPGVALRGGNRPGSTVRTLDEPAPTLVMGARVNDVRWVVGEEEVAEALEAYRGRQVEPGRFLLDRRQNSTDARGRRYPQPLYDVGVKPAPTLTTEAGRCQWIIYDQSDETP